MIFSPPAAPAAGRGPPSRLEERLSHNLPIFIHGSIARLLLNTLLIQYSAHSRQHHGQHAAAVRVTPLSLKP
jgi:hypothetical protein